MLSTPSTSYLHLYFTLFYLILYFVCITSFLFYFLLFLYKTNEIGYLVKAVFWGVLGFEPLPKFFTFISIYFIYVFKFVGQISWYFPKPPLKIFFWLQPSILIFYMYNNIHSHICLHKWAIILSLPVFWHLFNRLEPIITSCRLTQWVHTN